ncbi:hypothetical protein AVEN_220786-1, partial [Araneus ventricosus]
VRREYADTANVHKTVDSSFNNVNLQKSSFQEKELDENPKSLFQ